jgi:hypothetical protein
MTTPSTATLFLRDLPVLFDPAPPAARPDRGTDKTRTLREFRKPQT